jgi:glutamine amidotransferase
MANLRERGLVDPIRSWLEQGRPFLGICLGYQLLFESSEETPGIPGLGWLQGNVVRFPDSVGKIPHIGWNTVTFPEPLLRQTFPEPASFYHVHSFYPEPADSSVIACTTDYGVTFASGIRQGNAMAFQFHPEKSQANGLKLISIFLESLAVAA